MKRCRELFEQGCWEDEAVQKRKDGTPINILASVSLLKDSAGNPVGAVAVNRDITERKRADEELRESEERYRSLFENMIEGFAYCKMIFEDGQPVDFIYLDVNSAFEKQTGLKDVVGKRVTEAIPGIRESSPELFEIYGRVASTGKAERFEIYLDALEMWFSVSVYSPEKEYFVAVFDVITERKRLAMEIEAERNLLASLVASIPDEVWFTDPQKRFTLANPTAVQEFAVDLADGVDVEKLAHSLEVLRPDGSPRPVEEAPPLRALGGEIVRGQEEIVRTPAGGELRYRQVSAAPVRDASGNIIGSVSVVRDITERKRAEVALQRREQELRMITDNVPALVSYVDADGRYRFVNQRYEEWFGVPRTEIIGQHYRQVLGEVTYEQIKDRVETALSGQRVSYEEALPYALGGMRWVLADYVPDTDDQGTVRGFFALVTDITDRKRAEEALRKSEKQASAAIEAARGFTFNYDIAAGRITWGGAIEEITGYTPEEFAQIDIEDWAERIHPEDSDEVLSILQEAIETLDRATAEYRFRRKDGSYVTLASISLTEREDGKPVRLGVVQK